MKLETNNIYTFKLNTGEELIARIVEMAPDHMKQGLQMMPGLFSADLGQNVRLNNASWAMIAETRQDVQDSWIQATTGIAPIRKQIITG